uniref:Uncharacterized protein n=1 Tax=Anguilla anguilla TaxID=7936 RepID=A0A0E9PN66_ANGAN
MSDGELSDKNESDSTTPLNSGVGTLKSGARGP